MLILDLGNHNLILGRKWLAYHDIWLDVRNRKLLWPDQDRENYPRIREIVTTRERIQAQKIDPQHQTDVVRRDQAFQKEEAQQVFQILARPKKAVTAPKPQTFAKEYQCNLKKMKQELLKAVVEEPELLPLVWKPAPKDLVTIDIAMIGAAGFT